jgi:hypothetical protein
VRYFNTAGPCDPERHYMLPAEERLPEARPLVEAWKYFVVHAPRQTGKTTTVSMLLARLRERAPVCWLPELGGWLVTGYAAATEVLLDPEYPVQVSGLVFRKPADLRVRWDPR